MKALLIDPEKKQITTVITDESLEAMYALLGCDLIDAVSLGPDAVAFVDDEGLLKPNHFWRLTEAGPKEPLAGKALVFGRQGENLLPVFFRASQLQTIVQWIEPPSDDELHELTTMTITDMGGNPV